MSVVNLAELSLKKKWDDDADHSEAVDKAKKNKGRKIARKWKNKQYEELVYSMLDSIKNESPTAIAEAFDELVRDDVADLIVAYKEVVAEDMFGETYDEVIDEDPEDEEDLEFDSDEDIDLDDLDEETLQYIVDNITEEDFDQLDEISKKTLKSYTKKAADEIKQSYDTGDESKFEKRIKGHELATKKQGRQYIDSFSFRTSKSKEKRAKITATEDFEQLDELSKKTLNSYVKKADKAATKAWGKSDKEEDKAMSTNGEKYPEKQAKHIETAKKLSRIAMKRDMGVGRAQWKIKRKMKEEVSE